MLIAAACVVTAPGCSGVFWRPDLGGAQRLAARQNRIVVLAYWSPFDGDCIRMDRDVFTHKDVRSTLRGVICVRINAAFNRRFGEAYGLNRVPSFVTFGPDGRVLRVREGFMDEGRFRGFVEASKLAI